MGEIPLALHSLVWASYWRKCSWKASLCMMWRNPSMECRAPNHIPLFRKGLSGYFWENVSCISVEKAETMLGITRKQGEDKEVKSLCQCKQFYGSFCCFSLPANISLLFLTGKILTWDMAVFCQQVKSNPCLSWERAEFLGKRDGPLKLQAEGTLSESPGRSVGSFHLQVFASGIKFPLLLWRTSVTFPAGVFLNLVCLSVPVPSLWAHSSHGVSEDCLTQSEKNKFTGLSFYQLPPECSSPDRSSHGSQLFQFWHSYFSCVFWIPVRAVQIYTVGHVR